MQAGFGQSAFVGVGGDPILGTSTREALEALDADERTDAVVIVATELARSLYGIDVPVEIVRSAGRDRG